MPIYRRDFYPQPILLHCQQQFRYITDTDRGKKETLGFPRVGRDWGENHPIKNKGSRRKSVTN